MQLKNMNYNEFAFLVLEIVPQDTESAKVETLLNREDHYIQTLRPQYNIALLTTNSKGWKHTEEYLGKLRKFLLRRNVVNK
jgi:hypothetical protein